MSVYQTIEGLSSGELTVERSRFIAAACHVENEREALDFIAEKKAQYHDAKHNCYAYVLRDGISRFSDDGEPHSTAGKPMLEIIEGEKIYDVCVVVTRYFGGVLLGTGGLVRAYSAATREALANAQKLSLEECTVYKIICPYSDYDYLQKIISRSGKLESSDFTDVVTVLTAVRKVAAEEFIETLEKTFRERINIEKIGEKVLPV
ncbi:MAG: YigZ family protein [Ruminococcaceae bacterium]|nr:YigZ family protein [Oscillospiraceae bacterium]